MIDRSDVVGAVGLLLVLAAIWAMWGWIPVALVAGLLLIAYAFASAN